MKKVLIFAAIFLTIGSVFVFGQDRIVYYQRPFDASAFDKLPVGFAGNDAHALVEAMVITAMEIKQGCRKFEKTDTCQSRMNSMYDRNLTSHISYRDELAFSVDPHCKYSADHEKFECMPPVMSNYEWQNRLLSTGTYIGQNSFGVKARVTFKKFENISINPTNGSLSVGIDRIPPEKARHLDPHLKVLLIGELVQPFVKVDLADYPPTLNEPSHIKGYNYGIIFDLSAIWLYDQSTGEILVKRKLR